MNIIDSEFINHHRKDSIAETASELLKQHSNQYAAILADKIVAPVMKNADPVNNENQAESEAELELEGNNDVMFASENPGLPTSTKSVGYNYSSHFTFADFPDGSQSISSYNNLNISEENFRHLSAEEVNEIAQALPSLAESTEPTD